MAIPRRIRQKGSSLLVGIVSLVMIVPMAGLMIDVAILYVVKARLQAAVDGASLAAARALSLGATTAAQATQAQQNAVNWFYANFPTGNWGTTGTVMSTANVTVANDATVPQLRDVTITATTQSPTYFMKWFNYSNVTVTASGNASRRDVVVMLVLDRSGSMGASCAELVTAAKLFTGQFSEGRDHIGLISFSDNAYLHSAPTTSFQTTLGYSNSLGSGTGALDTIVCNGGTSTAQAIAMAENELVRVNLPGALNVIMFETDGLPNTLNLNFWDSTNNVPLLAANHSPCTDKNGKKYGTGSGYGGFLTAATVPDWTGGGYTFASSSQTSVSKGMIGEVYAFDPSQESSGGGGPYFYTMFNSYVSGTGGFSTSPVWINGTNCNFDGGYQGVDDFTYFPTSDIYGNQLNPATSPYKSVTMSNGYIATNANSVTNWTNYHSAVLNATDNAAYRARTNATIPATFFAIGLGGNAGDQPDFILLQRMANDPNGDNYNSPQKYTGCSTEGTCVNYSSQPQGTFVFSSNSSQLSQAFLALSSQILRLSK